MQVGNNDQVKENTQVNKSDATNKQGESQRPGAVFAALNGLVETEGQFEVKVVVPDEDTIVITIKRRDEENVPIVQLQFVLDREGKGRHRVKLTYYLIEGGSNKQLWSIMEPYPREVLVKIRSLLHTNKQGLPDGGKIAGIIEEVITQLESEAKRRWREYRARFAREHYEKALKEPGLREDPLRYVVDTLGHPHAGDETAKKVGFLAVVSSRLPEEYRLSVLFIAPSGGGKTNLLRALEAVTPKAWKLFEVESLGSSPLALFYHALMKTGFVFDLRRKVWFINEPSWLLLSQGEDPRKTPHEAGDQ
jgi:hypothetical protein